MYPKVLRIRGISFRFSSIYSAGLSHNVILHRDEIVRLISGTVGGDYSESVGH